MRPNVATSGIARRLTNHSMMGIQEPSCCCSYAEKSMDVNSVGF